MLLTQGEGRTYDLGPRVSAVFKEDNAGYSISEWWLEAQTLGPGAHSHPEDDVFYVLEGTLTFFVSGAWVEASKGSFVLAPGGSPHDFENRSDSRAGFLNVSAPGDFEQHMPGIAQWFRENDRTRH